MDNKSSSKKDEKSKSRRTVRATVPGAVSVEPPPVEPGAVQEPSAPTRSVSLPSEAVSRKSRRTAPATTPGAVAVPPSEPTRSVSLSAADVPSSKSSKSRRTTAATVPGAVAVEPSVSEPGVDNAGSGSTKEIVRASSGKGKFRQSARATKPGAVAVQDGGEEEPSREPSFDPDHIKTLTESMGYPLLHAQKGLLYGGGTVEGAVEWICQHENDPDLNEPIAAGALQPSEGEMKLRKDTVLDTMMNVADVAHTMQNFDVFVKWNKRMYREHLSAFHTRRINWDPRIGWYGNQTWFYDAYVIPLAEKMASCGAFGSRSSIFLCFAMENKRRWQAEGKAITEEMIRDVDEAEKASG